MADTCAAKTHAGKPCANAAGPSGACGIKAHQLQLAGTVKPSPDDGAKGEGKKSRLSAREIIARQCDVWRLRLAGSTTGEIASEIGCSMATVERDVREVKDHLRAGLELASRDPVDIIVEELSHLAEIRSTAIRDYADSRKYEVRKDIDDEKYEALLVNNAQAGLLNIAMAATDKRVRILQQTGYLRQDIGVLRVVDEKERAVADMSDDELRDHVKRRRADVDRLLDTLAESNRVQ